MSHFLDQLQFWWSRGLLRAHAVVMPNQGHGIVLVVTPLKVAHPLPYTREGTVNLSESVSLCSSSVGNSLSTVMIMGKRPSLCVISNGCEESLSRSEREIFPIVRRFLSLVEMTRA